MKSIKEKITGAMTAVFSWGILACLLVGGLTFIGYIAALIIGGDAAASICEFIYKKLYPILVVASTSMIVLGLVRMYISGETAFKDK